MTLHLLAHLLGLFRVHGSPWTPGRGFHHGFPWTPGRGLHGCLACSRLGR